MRSRGDGEGRQIRASIERKADAATPKRLARLVQKIAHADAEQEGNGWQNPEG
jgi:hypothetical protein